MAPASTAHIPPMEALEITLLVLVGWVTVLAFAVVLVAVARRADERHDEWDALAASLMGRPARSPVGFARSGFETRRRTPRLTARV